MAVVTGVVVGLVLGFVAGWLIRDARSRPLLSDDDELGLGVPEEWRRRQKDDRSD